LARENGKTKVDALGDVTRGIEVVEHSLAMPTLMMGDSIEQITNNMDTKSFRQVPSFFTSPGLLSLPSGHAKSHLFARCGIFL
jgi:hypothetical protein